MDGMQWMDGARQPNDCSVLFHWMTTLAKKVPVMKISITMVMTSWMMRRMIAAGHSSVMQRKP